jgi:hypothetical protein
VGFGQCCYGDSIVLNHLLKETQMTQNQFALLCSEHCISPDIALENDDIVEALKNRDDELVQQLLINEF